MPPDTAITISSTDMCRLVGCSYRQLDHWTRTEVLTPAHATATGSGGKRRWSERQIPIVRMVAHLARLGAQSELLRVAAEHAMDEPSFGTEDHVFVNRFGRLGWPTGEGYIVRVTPTADELTLEQLLVTAA